jgi:DNA-directed RNA polymerase specialized sigma24 family protein
MCYHHRSPSVEQRLWRCIAQLPWPERKIWLLHEIRGIPAGRIAHFLGVRPVRIEMHLRRAKVMLRARLRSEFGRRFCSDAR